jgi:hypothetical protein
MPAVFILARRNHFMHGSGVDINHPTYARTAKHFLEGNQSKNKLTVITNPDLFSRSDFLLLGDRIPCS